MKIDKLDELVERHCKGCEGSEYYIFKEHAEKHPYYEFTLAELDAHFAGKNYFIFPKENMRLYVPR